MLLLLLDSFIFHINTKYILTQILIDFRECFKEMYIVYIYIY